MGKVTTIVTTVGIVYHINIINKELNGGDIE